MSVHDWYRGAAWDDEARAAFEDRLGRARSGRAQYLRIKALDLAASEDAAVREAGRALLERVLVEHPDDELEVTQAHHDLAVALERDSYLEEAAMHYEAALNGSPNVDSGSALALAELIIRAGWERRYDEAGELLVQSGGSHDSFPSIRFAWNLAAARLANRQGQIEEARELAEIALKCLADNRAPYARHPDVGLIETDEETFRELEQLAGGET